MSLVVVEQFHLCRPTCEFIYHVNHLQGASASITATRRAERKLAADAQFQSPTCLIWDLEAGLEAGGKRSAGLRAALCL